MTEARYLCASGAWWGDRVCAAVARAGLRPLDCVSTAADLDAALTTPARYVFFLNWSTLVPTPLLDRAECVNFHCTALPYGRGGHPIEHLCLAGWHETLITAHRMTPELDAGPIYGRRGPIPLAGTKRDIQERFIAPCAELVLDIVRHQPIPEPQGAVWRRLSAADAQRVWTAKRF